MAVACRGCSTDSRCPKESAAHLRGHFVDAEARAAGKGQLSGIRRAGRQGGRNWSGVTPPDERSERLSATEQGAVADTETDAEVPHEEAAWLIRSASRRRWRSRCRSWRR